MRAGNLKGIRNTQNGSGVYHSLNVDVPNHWMVVPLEEVLDDIIGGGTPSKANPEYWVGSIPWLTVKDMRTRRPEDAIDHISMEAVRDSATNIIPAGTVIIATRIGLGKVIRAPYDAAINQDLKALVAKPELEKGYLEYWILSIAEYLESIGSGTTVKGIRLEQLRSLPFPLAPLNEQKRILAEIEKQFSRLDEAVANLKRVKANLKRYKASVLKAAVEGRLVPTEAELASREGRSYETGDELLHRTLDARWSQSKGKFTMPAGPIVRDLPELPAGWIWVSAIQACDPVVDCHNKTAPYINAGIPLVRTTNIRDGRLVFEDLRYVDQPTYEYWSRRCPPKPGDVLFTREAPMGEAGIIPPGVQLCLGQRTMLMRPSSAISAGFLLASLLSPVVKRLIDRVAVGSGVKHLRVGDVERLPIPLPPLVEQHRIVAEVERRLSVIEELEAAVEANLIRADRLRQSILQKAFKGKLIVQSNRTTVAAS